MVKTSKFITPEKSTTPQKFSRFLRRNTTITPYRSPVGRKLTIFMRHMVDREIPSFGHETVVESDPSTMKEVMLLVGGATFGLRDFMALPKGHPDDTISGLIGNKVIDI
jgi:hypothetical protein